MAQHRFQLIFFLNHGSLIFSARRQYQYLLLVINIHILGIKIGNLLVENNMKYMMKVKADTRPRSRGKVIDPHTTDFIRDTSYSVCWRTNYSCSVRDADKLLIYLLILVTPQQTQIRGWDRIRSVW